MSEDQNDGQNALTPLFAEAQRARTSLVSRGLTDAFRSRRLAALEAINAITRNVISLLDLDELLTIICQQLFEVSNWLGVDHVALLLTEGNELRVRAHQGCLTPSAEVGGRVPIAGGLLAHSVPTQRSILENDISCIEGCGPVCSEAQSEMCVPLVFFGEMLGVLILDCARKHAFSVEDMEAMESLADICAASIQTCSYFERMRKLAYMDLLTDVHNRRYFEMRIVEELERAQRFNGRMSLIVADIDVFHALNSEFGSGLCDEVLCSVATILKQELRKSDLACRYSQDDFAIIIPETTAEDAVRVAEKLRRAVESHHFPGVPRLVTISCGVADYPTHGRTRDELVSAAESAMHFAKSAGRNRAAAAR